MKQKRKNDVHLTFQRQPIANPAAMESSCDIDAAADREWFRTHPGQTRRRRPASIRELAALHHPPETIVEVMLLPSGAQMRCFI